MTDHAGHYAFPHAGANERRRLELFAERLDPLTVRRIKALDLAPGARCLEVGGGRGSIARWLCRYAGPAGRVTATDLEPGFLSELSLPIMCPIVHRRIAVRSRGPRGWLRPVPPGASDSG
jgi:hypothetical protein